MSETSFLATVKPDPDINLVKALQVAQTDAGASIGKLLTDIIRLQFGPGKLTAIEYFYYKLFDDKAYDDAARRRFAGRQAQIPICTKTNDPAWYMVAHDKLLTYAAIQGMGLLAPRTKALYHPARRFGTVPAFSTAADLAKWLRDPGHYPFFSKPVQGMYSVGSVRAERFDAATDSLILADGGGGRAITIDRFVTELKTFEKDGYLFQDICHPAPEIAAICGDKLATIRMMVLLTDGKPKLFRTIWKVPSGGNQADNFWRKGNMLAALDRETGKVVRVVRGYGMNIEHPTSHPDSGKELLGYTIPEWGRLKETVFVAAASLPGLRFQAWDVALSAEGPALVEVNIGGDFNLPQLATGAGIFDDEFKAFLAPFGIKVPA